MIPYTDLFGGQRAKLVPTEAINELAHDGAAFANRTHCRGNQISDLFDNSSKPCDDQQAVMRHYDVIAEVCDYMLQLVWKPYQNTSKM